MTESLAQQWEAPVALSEWQWLLSHPSLVVDAAFAISPPVAASDVFDGAEWVARRHDSLRSTLDRHTRTQSVHQPAGSAVECARRHSSALDECESAAAAAAVFGAAERHDLDPSRLGGFRCSVTTWRDEATLVYLAAHHAFTDMGSMNVIMRDLLKYLDARSSWLGTVRLALETPPLQHWRMLRARQQLCDDPATWEPGGVGHRALATYESLLAQFPLLPASQAGGGGGDMRYHRGEVSPALAASLRHSAREAGASLFQVLLAAYQEALWEVTGVEGLPTVCLVHGRTSSVSRDTVGLLAEEVVFRPRMEGRTRRDVLAATAREALQVYAALKVPVSAVARRSPQLTRLFRERFTRPLLFQFKPQGVAAVPASAHSQIALAPDFSPVPHWVRPGALLFNIAEEGPGLSIELLFDVSTWPEHTAQSLVAAFLKSCEAFAFDLDARIDSSVLSGREAALSSG